jgi:predicted O-linked N-acetylglucosamine transferase (SPINDLY family)
MKPGRNDSCPCGSGRKYKQCCAAAGVAVQAPRIDVPQTLNAALAAHRTGQLQQAAMLYQQVLQVQPRHSGALHMLGVAAHQGGQLDAAVELIGRALAVRPSVAQAHLDLANVLKDQGRLQEAAASYRRALALEPELADAHTGLGNVLMAQGDFGEAAESYRRALKPGPHSADAHYNLGNASAAQGRLDEAAALYRQALALQPGHPGSLNNLGNTLAEQGRPGEAAGIYGQLLAVWPDFAGAHNNLGRALSALGRLQEAASAFRRGLAINPQDAEAHSNLLYLLSYDAEWDAAALFAEHLEWARQHAEAPGTGVPPHANDPDPARRIKVGYVSPDLRDHAVAYFIEPVLACHERSRFEITCYSNNYVVDATTLRLQKHVDRWRNIAGLSDEAADALIRTDAIDILIDLSGHTAHNRLTLFARKPAPIQATWIGYSSTTGMTAMDYRLTDANLDPIGMTERYQSEQLVRLPVFACFQPAQQSPEVNALPALAAGHITFACLNNFIKVTPPAIECWARVLEAVPGSRLMLLLGDAENPAARQQVEQAFARHGIAPERLELVGKRPLAEYLALHHHVDIALDPFPYNGYTTSVHSLWMGVPVVTLAGNTAVSRVGVTILANAGLAELIAQSVDEYVEIARSLAQDTARLGRMRAGLRAQMQASPLIDAQALTRGLEDAYRAMWQKWCVQQRQRT